jgi:hypothetical protein
MSLSRKSDLKKFLLQYSCKLFPQYSGLLPCLYVLLNITMAVLVLFCQEQFWLSLPAKYAHPDIPAFGRRFPPPRA